jgi:DEAD/DEAH box helicase domain-containing protein
MKDPIGSFETIKENFIRYVKTAFGTKFEGVEEKALRLVELRQSALSKTMD